MSNVKYTSDNQRIVAGTELGERTKRVRADVTLYWRSPLAKPANVWVKRTGETQTIAPPNKVTSGEAFSAGTVAITQRRKSRHRSITERTHAHSTHTGNRVRYYMRLTDFSITPVIPRISAEGGQYIERDGAMKQHSTQLSMRLVLPYMLDY
ncbi:hypothetical protein SFRURICE_005576, partial [Spodoptera frugiperda]